MSPETDDARGCPLRAQRGVDGIHDFTRLLAALPPDLRVAFEAERAARLVEITTHIATHGYHT